MTNLGQLLAVVVDRRLDGATCRGRHALFDPIGTGEPRKAFNARSEAARHLCGTCPVLSRCAEVVTELPIEQRAGTWAGHTYGALGRIVVGGRRGRTDD